MKTSQSILPALLQRFFCEYLIQQRRVSAHTVASYRDTMRLLLSFLHVRLGRPPELLQLQDLTAPNISEFLDYCEAERGNSTRTRNTRLAAIRSFLRFSLCCEPECMVQLQSAMAIPLKKCTKHVLGYLTPEELAAVLEGPDTDRWSDRRDRLLFAAMYATGARVSEIVAVRVGDLDGDGTGRLTLHGKGRKERIIPLLKKTSKMLREWVRDNELSPESPLLSNARGIAMTRSGVEKRLARAVKAARKKCPSLKEKKVTPHTIRHTTAMHLLQSGVALTLIALLLGHEDLSTTHIYMTSDIKMKEKALNALQDTPTKKRRFQPSDTLLRFLDSL
jgi:site-specific recombinase XerD